MQPCLLADDLSGALEAGAAFRVRGWRVTLPLTEEAAQSATAAAGLRLITTESRNLSPEAAATVARRAARNLRAAGAQPVFKKIDSTMRGPIGAELAAVIDELKPPLVVFCPANPAAGRTVRYGVLRVHGVPLAATDFRTDPIWPASRSRIGELLEGQGITPAGQISLKELRQGGGPDALTKALRLSRPGAVVTSDAESADDLRKLVRAVRETAPGALMVGSGGLAAVLAEELPLSGGTAPAPARPRIANLLIVCGSGHPVSQRQMDQLTKRAGVSVFTHEVDVTPAAQTVAAAERALQEQHVAGVRFAIPAASASGATRRLLAVVEELTRALGDRAGLDAYYLTGGETAWAACRALEGSTLEVLGELEPGVVLSELRRQNRTSVLVLTKPGGFGQEDTIAKTLATE